MRRKIPDSAIRKAYGQKDVNEYSAKHWATNANCHEQLPEVVPEVAFIPDSPEAVTALLPEVVLALLPVDEVWEEGQVLLTSVGATS